MPPSNRNSVANLMRQYAQRSENKPSTTQNPVPVVNEQRVVIVPPPVIPERNDAIIIAKEPEKKFTGKQLAAEMRAAAECEIPEQSESSKALANQFGLETKYLWKVECPLELLPLVAMERECEELRLMKEGKEKKALKAKLIDKLHPLIPVFPGTPELLDFQTIAVPRAIRLIALMQHSCLSIKPTGSGKTFFTGYMIKLLRTYFPDRFGREIMIITKPTLLIQTRRVVCLDYKNPNVFILSYQQVTTATLSDLYISWETIMREDTPTQVAKWDVDFKPCLLLCDEVQCLKNDSTQSEVIREFSQQAMDGETELEPPPIVWGMSATPYSRPKHTKSIVCLIKPKVRYDYGDREINVTNFSAWIKAECAKELCLPDDWNEKAMARIQRQLEPYVIRFDKIHYRKRTLIKQDVIEFETAEKQNLYDNAYAEWLERMTEIEEGGGGNALVEIMKFRQKSELLRADTLAQKALNAVALGRSIIVATAFRETLELIKQLLIGAGYDESLIAEVKGGQTTKARQAHIDDFQADRRHIMLLMFSAGGAGLSLHQNNKENKRQRIVFLPPVWNAEELVQVLGRAHRVNSDSTTYQYIVWYKGTIEETVAAKVKKKCSSLRQVVGEKEDWTTAFAGRQIGSRYKSVNEEGEDYDDDDEIPMQSDLPIVTEEDQIEGDPDLIDDTLAITA